MKAAFALCAVALAFMLSGCAHHAVRLDGNQAMVTTSPLRPPDVLTSEGARVWKDADGRVTQLKLFSGPVFHFGYDKHGQVNIVREPDGAYLVRNGTREWSRRHPNGTISPYYGLVYVGNRYEVKYLLDDGTQIIWNANGYVVEIDKVEGESLIKKVSNSRGRISTIYYDAAGEPFSITTFDGFVLTRDEAGKWYRSVPGARRETLVPYTVERDPDSGYVTLTTPKVRVIYRTDGVREEKVD